MLTHLTSVTRDLLVALVVVVLAWVGIVRSSTDDRLIDWTQRQGIDGLEAVPSLLLIAACGYMILNRWRWQTARRASEEKYRLLVEQAADGIVLTRLDGTIIEVNAAALALTGYRQDELLGRNAAEIVPPADPAAHP